VFLIGEIICVLESHTISLAIFRQADSLFARGVANDCPDLNSGTEQGAGFFCV
jgi:hypothetical protein